MIVLKEIIIIYCLLLVIELTFDFNIALTSCELQTILFGSFILIKFENNDFLLRVSDYCIPGEIH